MNLTRIACIIWWFYFHSFRPMKERRCCVTQMQNHRGKWRECLVIAAAVVGIHYQLFIQNWHPRSSNGLQKPLAMMWWFNINKQSNGMRTKSHAKLFLYIFFMQLTCILKKNWMQHIKLLYDFLRLCWSKSKR